VSPATVRVLALRPVRGGVILRVHNEAAAAVTPKIRWQGKSLALGKIPGGAIRTWKLAGGKPKVVDLLTG